LSLSFRKLKKLNKQHMKDWFAHAFAVDGGLELSAEDLALLEKMASWLVKRKLAEPSIMALETCKPLNFVGSQALVFIRPFVHMVFKKKDEFDRFTTLLEDRGSIEKFIGILEEMMDGKYDKGEIVGEKETD